MKKQVLPLMVGTAVLGTVPALAMNDSYDSSKKVHVTRVSEDTLNKELEAVWKAHQQQWEIAYKKEDSIQLSSKIYRFEEPNEFWTLKNCGDVSKKLASISYSLEHNVTEDKIGSYGGRGNWVYEKTIWKPAPSRNISLKFSLRAQFCPSLKSWIQDVMIPSLQQLRISIWPTNYGTGLGFKVLYPILGELRTLLTFFVAKDELPQEKATEFWGIIKCPKSLSEDKKGLERDEKSTTK